MKRWFSPFFLKDAVIDDVPAKSWFRFEMCWNSKRRLSENGIRNGVLYTKKNTTWIISFESSHLSHLSHLYIPFIPFIPFAGMMGVFAGKISFFFIIKKKWVKNCWDPKFHGIFWGFTMFYLKKIANFAAGAIDSEPSMDLRRDKICACGDSTGMGDIHGELTW